MKIKLYIFLAFVFFTCSAFAQSRIKISGKVIDADNQGLELVSVRIGGTTQGTLTNLKGEYELTIASQDSIEVIFSCLGFRTEKRVLAAPQGNVVLNVRLYQKDRRLNKASSRLSKRIIWKSSINSLSFTSLFCVTSSFTSVVNAFLFFSVSAFLEGDWQAASKEMAAHAIRNLFIMALKNKR